MRSVPFVALMLLAGCTQPARSVAVAPLHEELPNLAAVGVSTQQATVKVQGLETEPRIPLTPDFKEPPLTAEEKLALGEREPAFKLLPYEVRRRAGSIVLPTDGGLETAAWGWGGADAATGPFSTPFAVADWGGPAVGIETNPYAGTGTIRPEFRQRWNGPDASLQTGVDRPARKARAMYRSDK